MDEFSWGNTRVVIGEGKEKKVITNEDEKFHDSMIPVKKFSGMCNSSPCIPFDSSVDRVRGGDLGNWNPTLRRYGLRQ